MLPRAHTHTHKTYLLQTGVTYVIDKMINKCFFLREFRKLAFLLVELVFFLVSKMMTVILQLHPFNLGFLLIIC